MSNEHIAEANAARASVPVSKQVTAAAEAERAAYGEAQSKTEALVGVAGAAKQMGYSEPVKLTRYAVEIRFGPTMMVATAEVDADGYEGIPNAIMVAGGLRLSSKLQTNAPSGNSFQKAAFIFTQSIHSVVVLSETEIK